MKILTALFPLIFLCSLTSLRGQEMKITDPTKNSGKVSWLPKQIKAGSIPYGVPKEGSFEIKNLSSDTLVILNVKSSCHCTVADWSKAPILPGESGQVHITYDALKEGPFYKIITITTNFDPEQSFALTMTGTVMPKD